MRIERKLYFFISRVAKKLKFSDDDGCKCNEE